MFVMKSKISCDLKKVCHEVKHHDVKKICLYVKKCVMIQKVGHDVKNMAQHPKFCRNVKNMLLHKKIDISIENNMLFHLKVIIDRYIYINIYIYL